MSFILWGVSQARTHKHRTRVIFPSLQLNIITITKRSFKHLSPNLKSGTVNIYIFLLKMCFLIVNKLIFYEDYLHTRETNTLLIILF